MSPVAHPQTGARLAEELQRAEAHAWELQAKLDAARREAEKLREAVRPQTCCIPVCCSHHSYSHSLLFHDAVQQAAWLVANVSTSKAKERILTHASMAFASLKPSCTAPGVTDTPSLWTADRGGGDAGVAGGGRAAGAA